MQEGESVGDIGLNMLCHGVAHNAALFDGKRRVLDKTVFQKIPVTVFVAAGLVLYHEAGDSFQQSNGRSEDDYGGEAEDRIECGNGNGSHGGVQQ